MPDKDITGPAWGEHLAAIEQDLIEHKELLLEQLAHVEGGLAALAAVKSRASQAVPQISDTQTAALKSLVKSRTFELPAGIGPCPALDLPLLGPTRGLAKAAEKAVKTARAGEAKTFSARWEHVRYVLSKDTEDIYHDMMRAMLIVLHEQDHALGRKDILTVVEDDKVLRTACQGNGTTLEYQFSYASKKLRQLGFVRMSVPNGAKQHTRWELA